MSRESTAPISVAFRKAVLPESNSPTWDDLITKHLGELPTSLAAFMSTIIDEVEPGSSFPDGYLAHALLADDRLVFNESKISRGYRVDSVVPLADSCTA